MNIKKITAPLREAWFETSDVRVLRVDARDEFKPGQFYMVGFEGLPGKAMSVSSSPTKNYLEFTAKLTSSEHKKKWASIQPGEPVHLAGPYGVFTLDETAPRVCLIAGGIGITPFKCYLEYALDKKIPADYLLLYSNRTTQDMAFSKYLAGLAAQSSNRLDASGQQNESPQNGGSAQKIRVVDTITRLEDGVEWAGRRGRIDEKMVREEAPDFLERKYYICGVPQMAKDMAALLEGMGVEKKLVKREEFTGLH